MANLAINGFAVNGKPILLCIVVMQCSICPIVSDVTIIGRCAERENQRGRDRIVGGIAEDIFCRDFPGIGEETVRIRIIMFWKFLHIEGQKLFVHHNGAILSRHDRARAVRAAGRNWHRRVVYKLLPAAGSIELPQLFSFSHISPPCLQTAA